MIPKTADEKKENIIDETKKILEDLFLLSSMCSEEDKKKVIDYSNHTNKYKWINKFKSVFKCKHLLNSVTTNQYTARCTTNTYSYFIGIENSYDYKRICEELIMDMKNNGINAYESEFKYISSYYIENYLLEEIINNAKQEQAETYKKDLFEKKWGLLIDIGKYLGVLGLIGLVVLIIFSI